MASHHQRWLGAVLVAQALLSATCAEPTDVDRDRLAELQASFGAKYEFRFEADIYVRMRQKQAGSSVYRDAERAYETFFFDDFSKRKRSRVTYVYLNVYDVHNKWLFQVCYDPQLDRIVQDRLREHY